MRPNLTTGRAIHSLVQGTLRGRCPSCQRASMFTGFIEMHERCPICHIRYQTESGAWLGAIAVGYGIGALVVVALGMVVAVPAYRPAKGFWFALLWVYGFTGDPEAPPPEL